MTRPVIAVSQTKAEGEQPGDDHTAFINDLHNMYVRFYGKFKFAILTTQAEGLASVRGALEDVEQLYQLNPAIKYFKGRVPDDKQLDREVIFAHSSNLGRSSSAILATYLGRDLPKLQDILLVGTASVVQGTTCKSYNVCLGDVVVSTDGMAEFELVKLPSKISIKSEAQASVRLTHAVDQLIADEMEAGKKSKWHKDLARTLSKVEGSDKPKASQDTTASATSIATPSALPRVHRGRLVSSPALMKEANRSKLWLKMPNIIALENSETGLSDVSWLKAVNFITVARIATYSNAEDNGEWLRYSSCASAAYAVAVIKAV